MKNEDKVGTKNMAEEMYAIGKGTKIDDNLNEATQRKCIRIKAFAPCRFSRIKIQEMRSYKLDYLLASQNVFTPIISSSVYCIKDLQGNP